MIKAPAVCLALWVCGLVGAGQGSANVSLQRNEEASVVGWVDPNLMQAKSQTARVHPLSTHNRPLQPPDHRNLTMCWMGNRPCSVAKDVPAWRQRTVRDDFGSSNLRSL